MNEDTRETRSLSLSLSLSLSFSLNFLIHYYRLREYGEAFHFLNIGSNFERMNVSDGRTSDINKRSRLQHSRINISTRL